MQATRETKASELYKINIQFDPKVLALPSISTLGGCKVFYMHLISLAFSKKLFLYIICAIA